MTSILTDWGKRCIEKLIKRVIAEARFVFCLSCIANEFDEERAKLEPQRKTLEQRVEEAKGRNKNIAANVVSWEEDVDKLFQEDTKAKQTCLFGFCPDCIWRYKTGKQLANDTEKINGLIEKADKFGNIEVSRPPPGVEHKSSQDYISFESRLSKYKELLDALKDDNNYITGLQGMGGTGKTTLAVKVGKELKESGQFTYVIDTTVSFTPDIKKIQDDIAGPLGLIWEGCNESDRPGTLWDRLTKGEKILLILDDVWDEGPLLDFGAIGIPKRDNHKGCRVLVTTRSKQLSNKMNFGKSIELELLSKEDVWTMFKWYANISESSSKDVKKKGCEIAKECKQLPVVIAVIASSLRGHHDRMEKWDATLTSLKKPVTLDGVEADLVGVFNCLKVSYDNMNDEKAKGLFRLCSVFPEDEEISVEVLTRLSIGAGLFKEDYGSYNDARNQVVVAKNKLLDYCLLLEVEEKFVKMHDLIRDVARWIARKENRGVNLSNKDQKSLIEKETNIKCLLFEGSYKDLFSCKFDGSKLETLITMEDIDEDCNVDSDEDCNMKIQNSFFENIVKLRVLYLSCYGNRSLSLANSFQSLKNIRCMVVQKVDLGDISILGNLQSLEALDLVKCKIHELPIEIEKLENLKLLRLESCEIRKDNPFEAIKICLSLEELYFIDSFNDFCREITLPAKLRRYHIGVRTWGNEMNFTQSKCVVLHEEFYETLEYFMQTAEAIELIRINSGWKNLIPEMVPIKNGMNELVQLHLRFDSELQCLIDTKHIDCQVPIVVFSKLVVLKLEDMEKLEELCNSPISLDCLNNLKEVTISRCNHLQSLFKCSLNLCNLKMLIIRSCSTLISVFDLTSSQSLLQLETLEIEDCKQLKNIFTYEERDDKMEGIVDGDNDNNKSCNSIMFPNLKDLTVVHCPQLQFILPCHSAGDLLSLESIMIEYCDKLKQLSKHPWDDTIEEKVNGDNDCNSIMFPNLKKLYVYSCPQLEFVLPLQSAQDLLLLESIIIVSCDKLKYIFGQLQDVQLPSLKELKFLSLPNFIDIFRESNHSMSSSIKRSSNSISKTETQLEPIKSNVFSWSHICCHRYKLKGPTSTEISFVSEGQPKDFSISLDHLCERAQCLLRLSHILCNIKELMLVKLSKIKSVFVLSITSRMMLESLTIENCDELMHIIVDNGGSSGSDNTVFPKLKELKVKNCGKLEYIFGHIDDSNDHQNHNLHLPALKCLKLSSLPSLTAVCTKNYRTTIPPLAELELGDCCQLDIKSIGDFIVKESSGNMEHFVALERLKVDNSKVEAIWCLNEVSEREMSLGLQNIELYNLPVMTCLFKGLKNYFSLKNLTVIKIQGCEKLEFVFSTSIIMRLPQLLHIRVEECKELKHMIEDDLENRKTVCFPKLRTLVVKECNMLKNVFPISICKVLPELKALMITKADELEEIFVCEEGDQKVNIPNLKVVAFVNLQSLRKTQRIHFQTVQNRIVQNCQELSLTSAATEDASYSSPFYMAGKDHYRWYRDFDPILIQLRKVTRDRDTCIGNSSSKTTEEIAVEHMLTSSQELMKQKHSLGEIDTTIKPSHGNNNLEGSTSEKPVVESLSTISGTKDGPPIQVIDTKQKGIKLSIEEETALTNTKTTSKHITTSEDQRYMLQEGSTSGTKNEQDIQLVALKQEGDMSSFEDVDLGDSHETTQTNNDQVSPSDDAFMKVSSNIEDQFPKDDEIIASKYKPSSSNTSPIAFQFPSMPSKVRDLHTDLGSIYEQLQKETSDRDTYNENPSSKTTEYIAAGIEVQVASGHMLTSSQLEASASERLAGATLSTISETIDEPPIQLVASKQKGNEIGFDEGTTSTCDKTITSSTNLEYGDGQIAIPFFPTSITDPLTIEDFDIIEYLEITQTNNDQGEDFWDRLSFLNEDAFKKVSSMIQEQFPIASQFASKDFDLYLHMESAFPQLQEEYKGQDNGNENLKAQTTKEFASWIEVQAALGHNLTSSQITMKETPEEEHEFVENELINEQSMDQHHISSFLLEEFINEQSMDHQYLMNQQHSLEETDTTVKPSHGNNFVKESENQSFQYCATSEKTAATTFSTILGTRNEPPIQLVAPKPKRVEEGNTLTNADAASPSAHLELVSSSQEQDVDVRGFQKITKTNNDQFSLNHNAFIQLSSNIEEQFPEDDDFRDSKSKPSPTNNIPLPLTSQTLPMPFEGEVNVLNPSEIVENSSSPCIVIWELEQLVSENYLDCENLSLLTDFFVKYPSVLLRDTSLSTRYKCYAYTCLAELLQFLQTHSVLDVLGSSHSEFVKLLHNLRSFGFDKDWLDSVERRSLFSDIQVSQDALKKLLDSKQQVSKEVEVLRLKIDILSQHVEDLKHQLTTSETVLKSIIQQEAQVLETKATFSAPLGY